MKNKRNNDGSVNAFQDTGTPGYGVTVEFSDSNFTNNIEDNILDAVLILNNKGYKTVTSCQGHSRYNYYFKDAIRYNTGPQITVQLPYKVNLPSSLLISTTENLTIESNTESYFISIRVKPCFEYFFTNKKLCSIIEEYCKRLPNDSFY